MSKLIPISGRQMCTLLEKLGFQKIPPKNQKIIYIPLLDIILYLKNIQNVTNSTA